MGSQESGMPNNGCFITLNPHISWGYRTPTLAKWRM